MLISVRHKREPAFVFQCDTAGTEFMEQYEYRNLGCMTWEQLVNIFFWSTFDKMAWLQPHWYAEPNNWWSLVTIAIA